jgi:hypothetical protein
MHPGNLSSASPDTSELSSSMLAMNGEANVIDDSLLLTPIPGSRSPSLPASAALEGHVVKSKSPRLRSASGNFHVSPTPPTPASTAGSAVTHASPPLLVAPSPAICGVHFPPLTPPALACSSSVASPECSGSGGNGGSGSSGNSGRGSNGGDSGSSNCGAAVPAPAVAVFTSGAACGDDESADFNPF